jgi:hypothetical protein
MIPRNPSWTRIWAFAAGLVSFAVAVAWAQQTNAERLAAARAAYEEGEFALAAASLRALLEAELNDPQRLEAQLYLGFAELQSGHETEAKAAFLEVLKLDPNYRLDPLRFAPKLRDGFERVRVDRLAGTEQLLGITIVQVEGALSPAEKPPKAFASRWWQKWWVIGLGVVAVGGATALLVGRDGPSEPVFQGQMEVLLEECAPIPDQPPGFPEGDLPVRVRFSGGKPPYQLSFSANMTVHGPPVMAERSPVGFTYLNLRVTGAGSSAPYTLRATLQDANRVSAPTPLEKQISIRALCPRP